MIRFPKKCWKVSIINWRMSDPKFARHNLIDKIAIELKPSSIEWAEKYVTQAENKNLILVEDFALKIAVLIEQYAEIELTEVKSL